MARHLPPASPRRRCSQSGFRPLGDYSAAALGSPDNGVVRPAVTEPPHGRRRGAGVRPTLIQGRECIAMPWAPARFKLHGKRLRTDLPAGLTAFRGGLLAVLLVLVAGACDSGMPSRSASPSSTTEPAGPSLSTPTDYPTSR